MQQTQERLPAQREQGRGVSPYRGEDASSFYQSPWQMMRRMHEDMDRMFGQFFGGASSYPDWDTLMPRTTTQWAPSTDISQTDKEWCVEVDLPGVNKDNVHVEVQNHYLTLRAELREESRPEPAGGQSNGQQNQQQAGQEAQGDQRRYHQRERRYGYFERVLPLPENVDEEQIRCDFENGVLSVHIPKAPDALRQGRKIPIGASAPNNATGAAPAASKS